MKLAKDWIALHGQSGEYPKEGVPIGCFTEAQIRQIQWDMRNVTAYELNELQADVAMDQALAKVKKP
jgi:hypothetical protein